jgi:hypothetical protein
MKTSIKITALLLAASFPCAAFAEILGANVPAILNVENTATLFSLLILGLTVISDYSRRSRSALSQSYARFAEGKGETHRLAA